MTKLHKSEDDEQIAVVEWCELMGIDIVHIPNEGKRSLSFGALLRRMGLRRGFPDLHLPYPCGSYHGLYIEMKTDRGRVSEEQAVWLRKLRSRGYQCWVCRSADEAIRAIREYFKEGESADVRF